MLCNQLQEKIDWQIGLSATEHKYAKEIGLYEVWQIYTRLKNRNSNVIIIHYDYRPICKCNFSLFLKHDLMYLTSIRSITAPPTFFFFFFYGHDHIHKIQWKSFTVCNSFLAVFIICFISWLLLKICFLSYRRVLKKNHPRQMY